MIVLNNEESYDNIKTNDIQPDYNALSEYFKLLNKQRILDFDSFKFHYKKFVTSRADKFITNENENAVLELLYNSCYSEKQHKGIGIIGISGVGKTTYFDFLNSINADKFDNNKHRLKYVSIRDISGAYQNGGIKEVENICSPVFNTNIDCLYIDDLGKEEVLMSSYGNKDDVMKKVIDFRYNLYKDTAGKNKFYFTSNYTIDYLKKRYTEVYFSRLYEMCKFVNINGKNLRY